MQATDIIENTLVATLNNIFIKEHRPLISIVHFLTQHIQRNISTYAQCKIINVVCYVLYG